MTATVDQLDDEVMSWRSSVGRAERIRSADVAVGEVSFHVNRSGDDTRDTIVWLHGSGPGVTALANWEWLLGEFSNRFDNVAPDIIGFGDSTHPDPAPRGVSAFTELRVETLLALLDELGVQRASFVGNSMGGIIALRLAKRAPERVDKLVLMGSGGAPVPRGAELMRLINFYDNPTPREMAQLLSTFVHDATSFDGQLDNMVRARMVHASRPDVRRSHLATFAPSPPVVSPEHTLARLDHPTLIVHGREDRIMPVAASQYLAARIPNAQLHIFPNAGHWLQIEHPIRFANLLLAFLGGLI